MEDSDLPTREEILTLVSELVPDVPVPRELFAEIKGKDAALWLEGWCDGCIAGKGFPPKGDGMLREKLDYISEITPGFLQQRAEDRDMVVEGMGFIPLEDKEHLYGVSWGVFRSRR